MMTPQSIHMKRIDALNGRSFIQLSQSIPSGRFG